MIAVPGINPLGTWDVKYVCGSAFAPLLRTTSWHSQNLPGRRQCLDAHEAQLPISYKIAQADADRLKLVRLFSSILGMTANYPKRFCHLCELNFADTNTLQSHQSQAHAHYCALCECDFRSNDALQYHLGNAASHNQPRHSIAGEQSGRHALYHEGISTRGSIIEEMKLMVSKITNLVQMAVLTITLTMRISMMKTTTRRTH